MASAVEDAGTPDPLSALLMPWMEDDLPCAVMQFIVWWDQWAVYTMQCRCGTYRGRSRGQRDMFRAIVHAYEKFLAAHPQQ